MSQGVSTMNRARWIRPRRLGFVAMMAVGLAVALTAAPASAARTTSFTFAACVPSGGGVQASMTWSGFKVDRYGFGFGQYDGRGAGFELPIRATSTGYESYTWTSLSNDVDLVGGDLSYQGQLLRSGTQSRPPGGWSNLPSC